MSSISDWRVWAEIDLDALANNLRWIQYGTRRRILTVVKADAYGHGLKQIASHLMQHGTDVLGVANLAEAADVRATGKGWPILMLGACHGKGEFRTLCQDKISATLSSAEEAAELAEVAKELRQSVRVHLKIDTGMGRLGVHPEQADSLASNIFQKPQLRLEGIYTHLSSAEEDAHFTSNQLKIFRECLHKIHAKGMRVPMIHVMNSAGIVYENEMFGNYVRPGLLVYGIVPFGNRDVHASWIHRLKAVMILKSRIAFLKNLSTGMPLGYGQRELCDRPTRLAIICAGYGDGILRSGSREVLVRGMRCPVKGRITMDQMLVDVSCIPSAQRGEEVILMGCQGQECLSANQIARRCGSIPWEVLTSITQRVPRVYRGVNVS